MKPLYLELSRFGSYMKTTKLDFSLFSNEGVFVVTGPTGAGKSTLFEAIFFALYGESSHKGRDLKGYRSDFAKDDKELSYVIFRFQLASGIYEIERKPYQIVPKKRGEGTKEQKHEVVLRKLGDEDFSPLTRIDEVREKIELLLGLNQEQFKKIIMLPQGEFYKFLLAGTDEKKTILRSLFGTERYLAISQRMAKESQVVKGQYKEIEQKIVAKLGEHFQTEDKTLDYLERQLLQEEDNLLLEKNALEDMKAEKNSVEANFNEVSERKRQQTLFLEKKEALTQHLKDEEKVTQLKEKVRLFDSVAILMEKERGLEELSESILAKESALGALKAQQEALEAQKKEHALKLKQREENQEKEALLASDLVLLTDLIKKAELKCGYQEQLSSIKGVYQHKLREKDSLSHLIGQEKNEKEALEKKLQVLFELKVQLEKEQNEQKSVASRGKLIAKAKDYQDELKAQDKALSDMKRELYLAEETYESAKKGYEALKNEVFELYRDELAKALEIGHACPVCGHVVSEKPTFKQKKISLSDYEQCEHALIEVKEHKEKLSLSYTVKENQRKNTEKAFKEALVNAEITEQTGYDLENLIHTEREKYISISETIKHLQHQLETEEKVKQMIQAKKEKILANEQLLETLSTEIHELSSEQKSIELHIKELSELEDSDSLKKRYQAMQEEKNKLTKWLADLIEADKALALKDENLTTQISGQATTLELEKSRYRDSRMRFTEAVAKVFSKEADYHALKALYFKKNQFQETINDWEEKKVRLLAEVKQLEKAIERLLDGDLTLLGEKLKTLNLMVEEALRAYGISADRLRRQKQALDDVKGLKEEQKAFHAKYSICKTLSDLANGNNPWKMDFETYALIYYYDKVLHYANERLRKMTSGRYYFIRQTDTLDKRKASGLGLDVMDEYTGRNRQVSSLSGGESFKASLALALGLSDVVREESGGIHLDAIFIDEGFGTLDEESLDMTLETLISLEEGGRLVGIISHVNELKERIGQKLIVTTGKNGSHAYIEAYSR